jgi:predicted transcriptional regulator
MTRYRSKLEIYLDVLLIVKDGAYKPTRIMFGANVSWKPMQKILNSMVDQGLITEISEEDRGDKRTTRVYKITEKGENTLKYFSRVRDLLVVM